jgi:hypothetical protein
MAEQSKHKKNSVRDPGPSRSICRTIKTNLIGAQSFQFAKGYRQRNQYEIGEQMTAKSLMGFMLSPNVIVALIHR